MPDSGRLRTLRVVLVLVGLIFIFGIYTLGIVWPSGWVWGEARPRSFIPSHYLMMIIGVYATLGVFLIMASKNPAAHASLISVVCNLAAHRDLLRRAIRHSRPRRTKP